MACETCLILLCHPAYLSLWRGRELLKRLNMCWIKFQKDFGNVATAAAVAWKRLQFDIVQNIIYGYHPPVGIVHPALNMLTCVKHYLSKVSFLYVICIQYKKLKVNNIMCMRKLRLNPQLHRLKYKNWSRYIAVSNCSLAKCLHGWEMYRR